MNGSKKSWKDWIDLQRVVPLITATLTFVAIAAANLGFLALSIPEQIILTVLGLLAVDALVERMRILEQIRHGLNTLMWRSRIPAQSHMGKGLPPEVTYDGYTVTGS